MNYLLEVANEEVSAGGSAVGPIAVIGGIILVAIIFTIVLIVAKDKNKKNKNTGW